MRDVMIALMQSLPMIGMWVILIFQNKQILTQKQQIRAIIECLKKMAEDGSIRAGATK